MSDLKACPFCRQMFSPGEKGACPDCELGLQDFGKLPPSYEQSIEFPEEMTPPHMETLPWTYWGRNRALLLAIAVAGFALFFAPWIHETAPELRDLSGFGLARLSGYFWAPACAWFVAFPLILTRRSVFKMRGSRVAVGFLAGIALVSVGLLLTHPPKTSHLRVVRIDWAWGLYASGLVALCGVIAAIWFGGKVDDLPTKQKRRGDETLH